MNGNLKYWFFVWVESNLHCVIGGGSGGGVKIKFEEKGRELVWISFVDEKDGARLEIYDPRWFGGGNGRR